ncbi:MAG: YdiU family protein [Cellulosilyticum sp.]|nr:YdiU family protein [Cellulosilyticum sp.]
MQQERFSLDSDFKLENTYISLPELFFSRQLPSLVPTPQLVLFNKGLASEISLPESFFTTEKGLAFLCGNQLLKESIPIAQAYAGHQFGYFSTLGDGRAILLGEYVTPSGQRLDVQLKGSGRTPYSRRGDGKAALGPMLREYIISEGMHALGIPTTRSLAVVTTGERVYREQPLEGAILTRLAQSHIRIGTFQYTYRFGSTKDLQDLADYTLSRHFCSTTSIDNPYLYLLQEVIQRQAKLIAKWQLVGFIHGVMNTDNILLSGETIDYGPCAFMDTYDPHTVFSSIDTEGRYAYGNQPKMAGWNLARFAETLLPLLHENREKAILLAQDAISDFGRQYQNYFLNGMRAKLGLYTEDEQDPSLINCLLNLMQRYNADYTNTFYRLTTQNLSDMDLFNSNDFKEWYQAWQARLTQQGTSKEAVTSLMMQSNPAIIPRNYRVEEALDAATQHHDYDVLKALLQVITKPYDYNKIDEAYMHTPHTNGCNYRTFCGT